jgi:hypothetical protein
MVQMFFSWRVKRLTSSMPMTAIVVLCSVVQLRQPPPTILLLQRANFLLLVAGIGTAVACGMVVEFGEFRKVTSPLAFSCEKC